MKLLFARYVLPLAAVVGLGAAVWFARHDQWDATLTAAVLGILAWFVRMRLELNDLIPPDR